MSYVFYGCFGSQNKTTRFVGGRIVRVVLILQVAYERARIGFFVGNTEQTVAFF